MTTRDRYQMPGAQWRAQMAQLAEKIARVAALRVETEKLEAEARALVEKFDVPGGSVALYDVTSGNPPYRCEGDGEEGEGCGNWVHAWPDPRRPMPILCAGCKAAGADAPPAGGAQ